MITQKQIDARDEYIKELESIIKNCLPNTGMYILRDYARNKNEIADADKEAADDEIIKMVLGDNK